MYPGFESCESHVFLVFLFILLFFSYYFFYVFYFFLSLLLQCKFANSTLLSLLSFSYFITPYDAQASSAFSALISLTIHLALIPTTHNHPERNPREEMLQYNYIERQTERF